jgi:hypothetical protein
MDYTPTLQYHPDLNPKLWDGDVLRPSVRLKLLEIGKAFQKFANIPNKAVHDILFTGGSANYNWTPFSDLDVHLLVTKADIPGFTGAALEGYLKAKKLLWGLTHSQVKVLGYPVEPYAQDVGEKYVRGQGIYSLTADKWLQRPSYEEKNLDWMKDLELKAKTEYYMHAIDSIIDHHMDEDAVDNIKEKIKDLRKQSIAQGGEFSIGNLTFKSLRNLGYLDRLTAYSKTLTDSKLSLDEATIGWWKYKYRG